MEKEDRIAKQREKKEAQFRLRSLLQKEEARNIASTAVSAAVKIEVQRRREVVTKIEAERGDDVEEKGSTGISENMQSNNSTAEVVLNQNSNDEASKEILNDSFHEVKDPLQTSESAKGEQQKSKSSQKKLIDAFGASDRIMSPPKKRF